MRFSIIASALVAALVGFGGTLAIVVEATRHLGATPDQTTSWVVALCVGMGVTSAWLSLRYRMPIVTAWSLAGAVLIIATPAGTTLGDAVAAAIFTGGLTVLAGSVPALGALLGRLPASIAGGMLAGLLLRFAIGLFVGAQTAPALVLPLIALFLLARLLHPASAPLIVIALALPLAWLEGYALAGFLLALPSILVAAVAGIALIGPLTGALASALHCEDERFPAVIAFVVTASNISLLGVGGAFWGLLTGVAALGLDRLAQRRSP